MHHYKPVDFFLMRMFTKLFKTSFPKVHSLKRPYSHVTTPIWGLKTRVMGLVNSVGVLDGKPQVSVVTASVCPWRPERTAGTRHFLPLRFSFLPLESLLSSFSFLGILKPPISFRTIVPRHQAWSWRREGRQFISVSPAALWSFSTENQQPHVFKDIAETWQWPGWCHYGYPLLLAECARLCWQLW